MEHKFTAIMNQFCSSCFLSLSLSFFVLSSPVVRRLILLLPLFIRWLTRGNCRNAILKYFIWLPTHESLKPATKDALKNILGFLRRCFFSFSYTPRFNAAAEAYKNRISGWNRPPFTQNDFQKPSVVSKSRHCSGNKGWWGGEREQIGSLSLAGLLLMASSWWHCL